MVSNSSLQKPVRQRRMALGVTAVALIIVFILWNIPALDFIVYPLRLFVTFVHEMAHSLAAILTGGEVRGFIVSPDGSGLAITAGGDRALIISAGYLGAALFGSLLYFVVNRFPQVAQLVSVVVGIGIVLFTVMFAAPDDQTGLPVALLVGIGFGAVLAFVGAKLNTVTNLLVLNVLAVMTALNAVLDVVMLMQFIGVSRGATSNDAVAYTRDIAPALPPSLVAMIWVALSVAMLAIAVYYGTWKPLTQEINHTYQTLQAD